MEPFAYQPPRRPQRLWLAVGVAGLMFAVWRFDLIPEIVPVETGRVQPTADFLAPDPLAEELWDEIVDHRVDSEAVLEPESESAEADPLLNAIAARQEPIESAFSEFPRPVSAQPPRDLTPTASAENAGERVISDSQVRPVNLTMQQDLPTPELPKVVPPEIAEALKLADQQIRDDQILEAHASLSRLYWKQPELRGLFMDRLELTAAEIYANPKRHFAEPYFVDFGDTLEKIANKHQVPWQYLAKLNGTTPQKLQAGQQLKVLRGPFGAVIDLSDFELTLHAHGWYVHRYRIGTGKDGRTPVGEFTVESKLENPTWYNPDGGTVDADDPANPLGEYWLGLGDHIGIHGTIDPDSIGRQASRGCIHMADGDIGEVFDLLGIGSPVLIRE